MKNATLLGRTQLNKLFVIGVAIGLLALSASSLSHPASAAPGADSFVYLPVVMSSGCQPISGATYAAITPDPIIGIDPAGDYRINLALRGYESVNKLKGLINNGPAGDTSAPQFRYLFTNLRTPTFRTVYALHKWDSTCNCPLPDLVTNPEVSVAGLATTPGEIIRLPESGYDIGGNDAMVLYAAPTRLVAKYTREDDIVSGYTLYLENVCVEPSLLALYQSLNAAGRNQLPALVGQQPLGRALSNEIGVSIRDSGQTQDPRSQNSWWLYP